MESFEKRCRYGRSYRNLSAGSWCGTSNHLGPLQRQNLQPRNHEGRNLVRSLGRMVQMSQHSHCQALSQRPIGFQDSVWSQITRSAAVMGMARTKPMPPHTQPQKSSAMVIATAFSRTRRPTSCGATRLIAKTWMVVSVTAIRTNCPMVFHFASAMIKAGSHAITAPMYGTMLSSPDAIPARMGYSIPIIQKNRLLAAMTASVTMLIRSEEHTS